MYQSPMKSVTDLRAMLEGFAARHAAEKVTQGTDPQKLLKRFQCLQQSTNSGDYRRFALDDHRLHQTIIDLAEIPGLKQAWCAAFTAQNSFRIKTLQQCWPDLSVLFESHRPWWMRLRQVIRRKPKTKRELIWMPFGFVWLTPPRISLCPAIRCPVRVLIWHSISTNQFGYPNCPRKSQDAAPATLRDYSATNLI